MEVVFHCATMAPSAESTTAKQLAYQVNVEGTRNVIKACQSQGVMKLVYTSSASVVFSGKDLLNVDESEPYADNVSDFYTQTKVCRACCEDAGHYKRSSKMTTSVIWSKS